MRSHRERVCVRREEVEKKKIPQELRGKKYTDQFSLQIKGAVTVEKKLEM